MGRGSGSTRASSSSAPKGIAPSGESLPSGWKKDTVGGNSYITTSKLGDEAKRWVVANYSGVSFGGSKDGDIINAPSLSIAKEAIKNGEILSNMVTNMNNSLTAETRTYWENQIRNFKKK